ncbi:hypothetical protein CALVIDRAFT_46406 [Calocera viscosa TUFC12733]|uniref:Uncharacterized protein n=1 Tax=Calocera viscosa (strain TUFC12733) TaxID=1330018 RepID=A0A167FLI2_CALVF|nr:hypothetical protein CALVIDRAFT_46406 [Calocera viscosa TUFC12733]
MQNDAPCGGTGRGEWWVDLRVQASRRWTHGGRRRAGREAAGWWNGNRAAVRRVEGWMTTCPCAGAIARRGENGQPDDTTASTTVRLKFRLCLLGERVASMQLALQPVLFLPFNCQLGHISFNAYFNSDQALLSRAPDFVPTCTVSLNVR